MRSIITLGLLLLSTQVYTQTNYEIVVNSTDAYQGNLFFHKGGTPPKNVMILSPEGEELFVENWGMKGWDFKVNANNHLTYFDRSSKGRPATDPHQQVVDSAYSEHG